MEYETSKRSNSGVAETTERTHCVLCGSVGSVLYGGLHDLWYGTPGSWNVLRCSSFSCRLAWLSPYLSSEFIGRAYQNYYTHSTDTCDDDPEVIPRSLLAKGLDLIHTFTGLARRRVHRESMYLVGVAPGRLLELGCGDGARLLLLSNLGWDVQGQDVDPKAVEAARLRVGCIVHLGSLEDLDQPKGSYDAIVMNHVLEHVPDPENLLHRCSELLVHGGRLVCAVPNFGSPAAVEFGSHWWGLDPPRHLFHFSTSNLLALAEKAGLAGSEVHTASLHHEFWLAGSYLLRGRARGDILLGGKISSLLRLKAVACQYWVLLMTVLSKVEGDECILRWQKSNRGLEGTPSEPNLAR